MKGPFGATSGFKSISTRTENCLVGSRRPKGSSPEVTCIYSPCCCLSLSQVTLQECGEGLPHPASPPVRCSVELECVEAKVHSSSSKDCERPTSGTMCSVPVIASVLASSLGGVGQVVLSRLSCLCLDEATES